VNKIISIDVLGLGGTKPFCLQAKSKQLNCTVFLTNHAASAAPLPERGATALRAISDVAIEITVKDGRIKVECTKARDTVPFPTFHIRMLPGFDAMTIVNWIARLMQDNDEQAAQCQEGQ
jgi:hypothetical protein